MRSKSVQPEARIAIRFANRLRVIGKEQDFGLEFKHTKLHGGTKVEFLQSIDGRQQAYKSGAQRWQKSYDECRFHSANNGLENDAKKIHW